MIISELKTILQKYPDRKLRFVLPNEQAIPSHFHVTEVGRVSKEFIDCDESSSCCSTESESCS